MTEQSIEEGNTLGAQVDDGEDVGEDHLDVVDDHLRHSRWVTSR